MLTTKQSAICWRHSAFSRVGSRSTILRSRGIAEREQLLFLFWAQGRIHPQSKELLHLKQDLYINVRYRLRVSGKCRDYSYKPSIFVEHLIRLISLRAICSRSCSCCSRCSRCREPCGHLWTLQSKGQKTKEDQSDVNLKYLLFNCN